VTLRSLAWPATIALGSLVAGVLVLGDVHTPLRAIVVITFLLVAPGTAWSRLLPLGDELAALTVGVALSIALDAAVAITFLYAGAWSPKAIFLVLLGFTLVGAALQAAGPVRRAPVAEGR
jgi:hypothetical protein